jgi:hypothetical protein
MLVVIVFTLDPTPINTSRLDACTTTFSELTADLNINGTNHDKL